MWTLVTTVLSVPLIYFTINNASSVLSAWKFVYGTFLKPRGEDGDGSNPQAFLENKYKEQASEYDATRSYFLPGREALLGLVAAQLSYRMNQPQSGSRKPIWIDIGGGTGYNVEAMSEFLPVPDFFERVYLVDLTPSLLEVARERFNRLGWTNIRIICKDASRLRLEDFEEAEDNGDTSSGGHANSLLAKDTFHADLITFSYSLSAIPDFCPAIDLCTTILSPSGVVGVVDYYVQNQCDIASRNYTAGFSKRHVGSWSRMFWRAWFDIDRINLDSSRRDYLEYKFGSILNVNRWDYHYRFIPYYIWIGSLKTLHSPVTDSREFLEEEIQRLNATATSSASVDIKDHVQQHKALHVMKIRSTAYDAAVLNLGTNLPLPCYYYQNKKWRLPYDEKLEKSARLVQCRWPFTCEDSWKDKAILKIHTDDVVLALTSGGDNILEYAKERPLQIHAVDDNPISNHVLELHVASYACLDHSGLLSLFGNTDPASFCRTLISRVSPYLSSRALQFWLHQAGIHDVKRQTPIASLHTALRDSDTFDRLSSPHTFEGLIIHTEDLSVVLGRIAPGSLTVVVVMHTMDMITSDSIETSRRIFAMNRVLRIEGRALLHSTMLTPSYIAAFDASGFQSHQVHSPHQDDRDPTYQSTWICTKVRDSAGSESDT